jgi:hypothetical protein
MSTPSTNALPFILDVYCGRQLCQKSPAAECRQPGAIISESAADFVGICIATLQGPACDPAKPLASYRIKWTIIWRNRPPLVMRAVGALRYPS